MLKPIDELFSGVLFVAALVLAGTCGYLGATEKSCPDADATWIAKEVTREAETTSFDLVCWYDIDPAEIECWSFNECGKKIEEHCDLNGQTVKSFTLSRAADPKTGEQTDTCSGTCKSEHATGTVTLTCSKKKPKKPEPVTSAEGAR